MNIAKIVGSNSHIDYVARIVDDLDSENPPSAEDYGFGQFVKLRFGEDTAVGIIYDSKLINPEYANYGPRLSPRPQMGSFTPDFINEQGILIGILLLGVIDAQGRVRHGVPRRIVPPGQDVESLDRESAQRFHIDDGGQVHIHYYSQIVAHAGQFALPLLDSIIGELVEGCSEPDRQRLDVLRQTLKWQGTIGGARL